jgi:hypothetical protein
MFEQEEGIGAFAGGAFAGEALLEFARVRIFDAAEPGVLAGGGFSRITLRSNFFGG